MPKKPSRCYRRMDRPPYTRKKYIRGYPQLPEGLRKFSYGNTKGTFPAKASIMCLKDIQVSAKALESVRITITRELKLLGEEKYLLKIKAIPFHVTRAHGLFMAKAERFAKGMRQSFGRKADRFARMKKGKVLLEVLIDDNAIAWGVCKRALQRAIKKLPSKWRIITEGISIVNLSATPSLPKRMKVASGGRQIADLVREV